MDNEQIKKPKKLPKRRFNGANNNTGASPTEALPKKRGAKPQKPVKAKRQNPEKENRASEAAVKPQKERRQKEIGRAHV